jgi:pentatricopeptide repeat protein
LQVKLSERGEVEKPPVTVFNTCVNVCEICDEQELTLVVLEAMKKSHDTEGNIITFNIALKRLAKQGNPQACEGIIIGMLQAGVEPTVVSYTTAIAACCAADPKNPTYAYEWIRRMRSRGVKPNVISYNTALATCLDGKLESSALASKIASEMLSNVEQEIQQEEESGGQFATAIPDVYTKTLARQLMQQLRQNWRSGAIDKLVATSTLRVPLLRLVEFQKSEVAAAAREKVRLQELSKSAGGEETEAVTERDEVELEYSAAASTHRVAEV